MGVFQKVGHAHLYLIGKLYNNNYFNDYSGNSSTPSKKYGA